MIVESCNTGWREGAMRLIKLLTVVIRKEHENWLKLHFSPRLLRVHTFPCARANNNNNTNNNRSLVMQTEVACSSPCVRTVQAGDKFCRKRLSSSRQFHRTSSFSSWGATTSEKFWPSQRVSSIRSGFWCRPSSLLFSSLLYRSLHHPPIHF
jgi:hypothetical protein